MNHKSMKKYLYLVSLVLVLNVGCKKEPLTINIGTISCLEGTYFNVNVGIEGPFSRTGEVISWMSSDTDIVSAAPEKVNSDVTSWWCAKKMGHCTITCDYRGKTAFCHVSVVPKIDAFRLDEKLIEMSIGDSQNLNFHLTPSANLICGDIAVR